MWWWVLGCTARPTGGELPCTGGKPWVGRMESGVELQVCRDPEGRWHGPQRATWPNGVPAQSGTWASGVRDGVWTSWDDRGAFVSRSQWVVGQEHGARTVVGLDGVLVEFDVVEGRAASFRTLAPALRMPEWDAGRLVESARYAVVPP